MTKEAKDTIKNKIISTVSKKDFMEFLMGEIIQAHYNAEDAKCVPVLHNYYSKKAMMLLIVHKFIEDPNNDGGILFDEG